MRLPTVRGVLDDAGQTLRRFPLTLGLAAVSAALGIMWSTNADSPRAAAWAATSLGLPLALAIAAASERLPSRRTWTVLRVAMLLGLVAFALAWPTWTDPVRTRRYLQFSLAAHLLVAFLPYVVHYDADGFWQWNRALFLRFLTAALHSVVLFTGLAMALLALDRLFQVHVPGEWYGRLWLLVTFVFNTWFFLGGLPADLRALDGKQDYPQGLERFARFLLIPIVVLDLALLTAYLGRILLTAKWPSGWIGYLVSSVAAVGTLSLLLVHPIRHRENSRWVGVYTRWFYVALLPAIGMLLVAIGRRIAQYGITEDRYVVAVLTLWLTAIAVAFIARRETPLRLIPLSLCALALVTGFGPWGAYSVSRHSQIEHLRRLFAGTGIVEDGVVRPARSPVPPERRLELSSTLAYLMGAHGSASLRPVLGGFADSVLGSPADSSRHVRANPQWQATRVMTALGLEYLLPGQPVGSTTFSYYGTGRPMGRAAPIAGMDYHVVIEGALPETFTVDGVVWDLDVDRKRGSLGLGPHGHPVLWFDVDSLAWFARHVAIGTDSTGPPVLDAEGDGMRARLAARSYYGSFENNELRFGMLNADLFLDRRP